MGRATSMGTNGWNPKHYHLKRVVAKIVVEGCIVYVEHKE
jgi:hypothetical protein